MIRKLIILAIWALTIAGAGAFWGLCLLVGDPNIAPWPAAVAGGAAGTLALVGLPLMIAFLIQYSHQRGRHASAITRSRARYFQPSRGRP